MSSADAAIAGIALGKRLNDRDFEREAEILRNRLKRAENEEKVAIPLHLGALDTVNDLVEEIKEIKDGKRSPDQARLSAPGGAIHRIESFLELSNDAARRLSGGALELNFPHESIAKAARTSDVIKDLSATLVPTPAGGGPRRKS